MEKRFDGDQGAHLWAAQPQQLKSRGRRPGLSGSGRGAAVGVRRDLGGHFGDSRVYVRRGVLLLAGLPLDRLLLHPRQVGHRSVVCCATQAGGAQYAITFRVVYGVAGARRMYGRELQMATWMDAALCSLECELPVLRE